MIIALNPEFYPYIGDRDFTRSWNAELARWKQWRHPFIMARAKAWECEKDGIRKWWFSLSRRERHYWMGRRDDGEFPNVLMAAGFKGPKHQRGNFAMFPAGTMAILGGLALDAANNFAVNIDVGPPFSLYATFYALRTGFFQRDQLGNTNTGTNPVNINTGTDWITPRNATIGDSYEIKWNALINPIRINDESYAEDAWVTINSSRSVGQLHITSSISSTFELDIGDVGTSTSIVNQNYSVEAGDII